MEKISNLINKRLNQHKLNESALAAHVLHAANLLLKEWLKSKDETPEAVKLSHQTLWVNVRHAGWGQEVWGISQRLLRELQKKFGKKLVKKIQTKSLELL